MSDKSILDLGMVFKRTRNQNLTQTTNKDGCNVLKQGENYHAHRKTDTLTSTGGASLEHKNVLL
jgi:hypothetical protein